MTALEHDYQINIFMSYTPFRPPLPTGDPDSGEFSTPPDPGEIDQFSVTVSGNDSEIERRIQQLVEEDPKIWDRIARLCVGV